MSTTPTLYDKVIVVAEDYFGPAAPRFVDRLITNHLNKTPGKITVRDIPAIAIWIKLTVAVLTDDEGIIDQFTDRLNELAVSKPKRRELTNK